MKLIKRLDLEILLKDCLQLQVPDLLSPNAFHKLSHVDLIIDQGIMLYGISLPVDCRTPSKVADIRGVGVTR
jgi:hypothetical protein